MTKPIPPVPDATAATAPRKKPPRAAPLQTDRPWRSDQTDPPDASGSSPSVAAAEATGKRSAKRQKARSEAALDNVSKGYD